MGAPRTVPYGAWPSPLDARQTLAGTTRRSSPRADGPDLYFLEARPQDAGRVTLVRRGDDGSRQDVSPADHNVRTSYLEYGGGEYAVRDGIVIWVDFGTQAVWVAERGEQPRRLTPEAPVRWSCFRIDPRRRVLFCLREDTGDPELESVNSLVRLDLDGANADLGAVLVPGRERRHADRGTAVGEHPAPGDAAADFVTDPVLSPDAARLAWLTWDHPRMPWQATSLWVGQLTADGDLEHVSHVATGEREALEQPTWLDPSTLLVLSDRSGWSNLHRVSLAGSGRLVPVTTGQLDLGHPRWVPDTRSYAVLPDGRVASARSRDGFRELVLVDPGTGTVAQVETGTTFVGDLAVLDDGHTVRVAVEASRAEENPGIILVDPATGATQDVVPADDQGVPAAFAVRPEPVSWPTPDGATAYGFLYPPAHPEVVGPAGEAPPLIVTLHGGPTSCARPGLRAARAYWTSRGFAVLDVNYGGSTGYGRAYQERLEGRWGLVDVQDAASGARHLARTGVVDGARLLITGASAGGFTTLAAATFTDTFAAGASHFGVSDLSTLARDTHKLESRYCDGLVAPWPEGQAVYDERSPIRHVDRLRTPLILLQGTDDAVVPPAQAEVMAEALREKGLPVALVLMEGEGHGFRRLENQVRALEAELSFYAQVLGLDLPEGIDRVVVENLGSSPAR